MIMLSILACNFCNLSDAYATIWVTRGFLHQVGSKTRSSPFLEKNVYNIAELIAWKPKIIKKIKNQNGMSMFLLLFLLLFLFLTCQSLSRHPLTLVLHFMVQLQCLSPLFPVYLRSFLVTAMSLSKTLPLHFPIHSGLRLCLYVYIIYNLLFL